MSFELRSVSNVGILPALIGTVGIYIWYNSFPQ